MNEQFLSKMAEHGNVWCLDKTALSRFVAESKSGAAPAKRLPRANGTVAVIPIHGVMTQRGFWGDGGTDDIGRTLDAAMANSSFSGVVLDVDSPGGSIYGLPEFADKIFGYRNAGKPLVAIANSLAASAAIWGPSSAPTFVGSPSSDIGNIGVWMLHFDYSDMLKADGIKPTFVVAGKYKVENNPLEPMTDEGRAAWQASVDETYHEFLGAMARNRGVSLAKVRDEFGEGRTMSAPKAKAVGMIDRVDTLDGVLSRMRATATADPRYASSETELSQWLSNVWTSGRDLPAAAAGRVAVAKARRERERSRAGV